MIKVREELYACTMKKVDVRIGSIKVFELEVPDFYSDFHIETLIDRLLRENLEYDTRKTKESCTNNNDNYLIYNMLKDEYFVGLDDDWIKQYAEFSNDVLDAYLYGSKRDAEHILYTYCDSNCIILKVKKG